MWELGFELFRDIYWLTSENTKSLDRTMKKWQFKCIPLKMRNAHNIKEQFNIRWIPVVNLMLIIICLGVTSRKFGVALRTWRHGRPQTLLNWKFWKTSLISSIIVSFSTTVHRRHHLAEKILFCAAIIQHILGKKFVAPSAIFVCKFWLDPLKEMYLVKPWMHDKST